jgi:NADP-dependent 3-hydroxy acid dehydrogenase YdfG
VVLTGSCNCLEALGYRAAALESMANRSYAGCISLWGVARVMLITGASSGIGAATARLAVARGHRVALLARSSGVLHEFAAELGGPEHALAVPCDVAEFADLEAAVRTVLDGFGQIDVVFANAGIGAARGFLNESVRRWREMVLTNVLGVALTVRATLEALQSSHGHLVLTGSLSARRPLPGSLYSATKASVRAIADAAHMELDGTGVRVTLIEAGTVDTPFFDNPQADALQPADVAETVLYAVSQPAHIDTGEIALRSVEQRSL